MSAGAPMSVEAVLVLSFGGPEGAEDVMPFLRNVTRGRGVPEQRLEEVAARYARFHGVSPSNAINRRLVADLRADFAAHQLDLPLYWGNRNWKPYLADAVRQMRDDGIARALVFATSATASYSACRQYREDLAQARSVAGQGAPELIKLRHFYDHPGFVTANLDAVRAALQRFEPADRDRVRLVFTAHSIPLTMDVTSGPLVDGLYHRQHHETARLVAEGLRGPGAEFDLVWQSRSGPPEAVWLTPDINDHLRALADGGCRHVLISPTGFVSDHFEVIWDLDVEARHTAAELGIQLERAAAADTHPAFIAMIRELVQERVRGDVPATLSPLGLSGAPCPIGCCPAPPRRDS